jgi:uncharacterized protein YbjT (DUF2867 family)
MGEDLHVVTGAYGYSGRYIAERLLAAGHKVRTLTNSPNRANSFGDSVEAHPFNFDDPDKLADSLKGAKVLYNTYWVRFNADDFRHSVAVENTLALFRAAKEAGVERVIHVSITNPSEDSPLEYFAGKARLEKALIESGLSYAILRPTVLFGKEDILVNNIAWVLRHLPVFGVFGDGSYKIQPIYVDDIAKLAVEQGASRENRIIDAIGPETFTYRELVETIGKLIGKPRKVVGVPPGFGYLVGWFVGKCVGDLTITREEIKGLMDNLLVTKSPPAGDTKLTEWVKAHADELGKRYASELARRRDRSAAYDKL